MLLKRLHGVPFMKEKQPLASFILIYIFVIEVMLVCTTNSMGTSQFILFLALCYSVDKKHINCLMVYLIHPVDPLQYDSFLCSWLNQSCG